MSILKELYNGNLLPWERPPSQDPQYQETDKKIKSTEDELEKILEPKTYKKVDRLIGLYGLSSAIEQDESFVLGFKLGVKIMVESIFDVETEIPIELINNAKLLLIKQNKENAEALEN